MSEIIKAGKDQVVVTKCGFEKDYYDSSIKYLCKHK